VVPKYEQYLTGIISIFLVVKTVNNRFITDTYFSLIVNPLKPNCFKLVSLYFVLGFNYHGVIFNYLVVDDLGLQSLKLVFRNKTPPAFFAKEK
jgi:succinate dehydrogenase hydrophobic anchor subunit